MKKINPYNTIPVLILFIMIANIMNAQQLCMEERKEDVAIIKDLYTKDGKFYLTVDVVQIVYDEDGFESVKNENPKLRTFLINPDTEWNFCISAGDRQGDTELLIKVRDLVKRRDLFLDAFVNYTAKAGKVLSSGRVPCGAG